MAAPRLDPKRIAEDLAAMNRSPFRAVLARFLECAPSDEAIATIAERNPDRWAQALAIVARLGGFNERLEVEGTVEHRLADLSDAALLARLADLQRTLDSQSSGPTSEASTDTGSS